jgi:hypothetical protein
MLSWSTNSTSMTPEECQPVCLGVGFNGDLLEMPRFLWLTFTANGPREGSGDLCRVSEHRLGRLVTITAASMSRPADVLTATPA